MAINSFRINGKVHYGQHVYRPSPSTIIPTAIGVVHSVNPGTLVLSGFKNLNLDEIQINEGAHIEVADVCLYVIAINNRTEDKIILTVTDYELMM
jgi:hypothetical protein